MKDRVAAVKEIRSVEDLASAKVDALIIPGGESTTMALVAERTGLLDALREWVKADKPVWGVCAGMILLSNDVSATKQGGQKTIGGLDISVKRNAFGTQLDSFQMNISIPALGDSPFPGVFIRAPVVEVVKGDSVIEVIGRLNGQTKRGDAVVAVRQANILACAFHPELTGDDRFHNYFLDLVSEYRKGANH
ncbi:hypothetical protein HK101_001538 [Irineochytrium annulatum]|nr:hypothetical protein HK101_001538 [Irineochytrium annulatum]